MKCLKKQTVF